jgi:hypothetical protein
MRLWFGGPFLRHLVGDAEPVALKLIAENPKPILELRGPNDQSDRDARLKRIARLRRKS